MKKVDYRHFGRFVYPHTLTARGKDLYFCVKKANFNENCYRSDLYLLRDGHVRPLTSSGDVGEYHLLDDHIVFASLRKKKDRETAAKSIPLTVLQGLPYDGGEAQELLRLPYSVTGMCFLSEKRFFFTAKVSREFEAARAVCNGNAEKAAALVKEDSDYRVLDEIPFCSNGAGYINGLRSRLFLYDGGTVTPVSDEDSSVRLLTLSPDGGRLWFAGNTFHGKDPFFEHLYELNTKTLKTADISVGSTDQYYGVYPLPGGKDVILASVCKEHGVNENACVFVREHGKYRTTYDGGKYDFNSSVCTDILAERAMPSEPMVRGNDVFLIDTQGDSSGLVSLDPENGAVHAVTKKPGCVSEAVLYGDGFAAVALRGNGGCEIYSVSADGREKRLTDLNTAVCREYEYSEPQKFAFSNDRGVRIDGWVIPPVGRQGGKKYPAILDVHGGPKTAYGDCYFHEMQLWAGRGFAVLYCNPTGSSGRGDGFADIRGGYGGQDYRDIMAFVGEAVRRFDFIDPDRMGVTGGSYGGFMTNWIIGHTDRFKAAASQRSIVNWLSYYGTSDIGYFFTADQTGAGPWDHPEKAWEQSPLRYADRVTTPTLFIHSDEDFRCPLSGGLQMFTALRTHGIPTRLCLFKGENHELSRSGKPLHRIRRLKEITEWFEKYLKSN
mgnify:CR=1 FL=1